VSDRGVEGFINLNLQRERICLATVFSSQQFSARGYVQVAKVFQLATTTLWLGQTVGSMRGLRRRCLLSQHIAIAKIKLNGVMNKGLD
jgi:hypothetical protein